jgi:hypothetical protein
MDANTIPNDALVSEGFHATKQLRWIIPRGATWCPGPILQQAWQGDQGTIDWRTVPAEFVSEQEYDRAKGRPS